MVAWLAAAAPIVGAALDLVSGERAARKQRKHTQGVATDEAFGSVMGRVEAAKAAGLHPLAALGTPSSSGMSVGGGMSDFRSAFSESAGAVTQQRQWKAEREYQEANDRNMRQQQQNAEQREQARLNADLAMINKQMQFIDEQIRSSQEESLRRSMAATPGLRTPVTRPARSAIPSQYVPVRTRTGEVIHIPNPDLYDLELPSTVGAGTLAVPELSEGGILNSVKTGYDRAVDFTSDVLEKAHNFHKRSQRWLYRPPSR